MKKGVRADTSHPEQRPNAATSQVRARVRATQRRVLVVDDDPSVRAMTAQVLRSHGFDVLAAKSGEEAISIYRALALTVDLVLLDMQMPGIDGLETFRALKMLDEEIHVVLVSGAGRSDRVEQAMRDGAHAFLDKPFSPEDLTAVLERSDEGGCADP